MDEITLFCAGCEEMGEGASLTVSSEWEARERYEWSQSDDKWYCKQCTKERG